MTDEEFDAMSAWFEKLVETPEDGLENVLKNNGRPPAQNYLALLMEAMRVRFGAERVSAWIKRCGELGILT